MNPVRPTKAFIHMVWILKTTHSLTSLHCKTYKSCWKRRNHFNFQFCNSWILKTNCLEIFLMLKLYQIKSIVGLISHKATAFCFLETDYLAVWYCRHGYSGIETLILSKYSTDACAFIDYYLQSTNIETFLWTKNGDQ